tara:strand:+ start:10582 stop:10860 length:279 start_codon:yes stop_codon:yes gene_type:complete
MKPFTISTHAKERAVERFGSLDAVFPVSGKKPTKKQRSQIKKQCPLHSKTFMSAGFMGRYFIYNRNTKCVYVIADSDNTHVVVSVFKLESES